MNPGVEISIICWSEREYSLSLFQWYGLTAICPWIRNRAVPTMKTIRVIHPAISFGRNRSSNSTSVSRGCPRTPSLSALVRVLLRLRWPSEIKTLKCRYPIIRSLHNPLIDNSSCQGWQDQWLSFTFAFASAGSTRTGWMSFSLTRLLFTLYLIIPVYHVLDSRYHVPTEERSETSLEFEPNLPLSNPRTY